MLSLIREYPYSNPKGSTLSINGHPSVNQNLQALNHSMHCLVGQTIASLGLMWHSASPQKNKKLENMKE